jgi:hypothetical protein
MFSALGWALMSAPTPAMPADALAQHEGVLRADRGDQRERCDESEDQRRAHAFTVGSWAVSVQLMILQLH